jgi:hypothetical protein
MTSAVFTGLDRFCNSVKIDTLYLPEDKSGDKFLLVAVDIFHNNS